MCEMLVCVCVCVCVSAGVCVCVSDRDTVEQFFREWRILPKTVSQFFYFIQLKSQNLLTTLRTSPDWGKSSQAFENEALRYSLKYSHFFSQYLLLPKEWNKVQLPKFG